MAPVVQTGAIRWEGANFRCHYSYCRQIRKPLIPSTITTFIRTLIPNLRITFSISRLVSWGLRHGMNIEAPRLNAFQFISYLTPSTSIFGLGDDKLVHVKEATCCSVEHQRVYPRRHKLHAFR